jgi:hypothetical protein
MVERMVDSTFSSSNMHVVLVDNSNPYSNMVMEAMRMNQDYAGECSIIDEEPNAYSTRFSKLFKDSDETLWDECTNHSKLSVTT